MLFFTPTAVNMLGFKVNAVDHASVINFGPVQYIDQFMSYKRNQGFGEQNGDLSPSNIPLSVAIDPDLSDSNSLKGSAF